eukprot:NODE_341_length_1610_cov_85.700607_g309_i0.p1 GENE.NODE_341_length_1610_cov_85.700607_g309_i0~~NODE_341_length_1610_cov_85.700607_g309_i0.p1  ORF type:complete len:401 (+),score=93.87 NODE_341_length_1610_cov_85.700607_g309_i0:146-1348(+)
MVFAAYKQKGANKKNLLPETNWASSRLAQAQPQIPAKRGKPTAGAATATPRGQAQAQARTPSKFTGPFASLGVCLHNMPAPKWLNTPLTDEQKEEAAKRFTEGFGAVRAFANKSELFTSCNGYLLSVPTDDAMTNSAWFPIIGSLRQQLAKLTPFSGTAYRSCPLHPVEKAFLVPGKSVRFRSFVSATKEPSQVTGDEALLQFKIKDMVAADISKMSPHPTDGEVLIDVFSEFIVDDVTTQNGRTVITFTASPIATRGVSAGAHLLFRADNLDEEHMQEFSNAILSYHGKLSAALLPGPVHFENNDNMATALVEHAEDSMEWKVVMIGGCTDAALKALLEVSHPKLVSVLVVTDPNVHTKEAVAAYLRHPLVCDVVTDMQESYGFITTRTLTTHEIAEDI